MFLDFLGDLETISTTGYYAPPSENGQANIPCIVDAPDPIKISDVSERLTSPGRDCQWSNINIKTT